MDLVLMVVVGAAAVFVVGVSAHRAALGHRMVGSFDALKGRPRQKGLAYRHGYAASSDPRGALDNGRARSDGRGRRSPPAPCRCTRAPGLLMPVPLGDWHSRQGGAMHRHGSIIETTRRRF
jgi:hypothetical protein